MDRRIDVPCGEELEAAITTLATLAGVPRAEYARRVLLSHAFGELGIAQRMARAGGGRQWDESPS